MSGGAKPILVLDAMGALYRHAEDVDDLFVPFIAEGGTRDVALVNRRYREASLGWLAPDAFWRGAGLAPQVEDSYLKRHELFPGLARFPGRRGATVRRPGLPVQRCRRLVPLAAGTPWTDRTHSHLGGKRRCWLSQARTGDLPGAPGADRHGARTGLVRR